MANHTFATVLYQKKLSTSLTCLSTLSTRSCSPDAPLSFPNQSSMVRPQTMGEIGYLYHQDTRVLLPRQLIPRERLETVRTTRLYNLAGQARPLPQLCRALQPQHCKSVNAFTRLAPTQYQVHQWGRIGGILIMLEASRHQGWTVADSRFEDRASYPSKVRQLEHIGHKEASLGWD